MRDITIETTEAISTAEFYNRFNYGSAAPATGTAVNPNTMELAASGIDFKWTQQSAPARSLQVTATKLQVTEIGGWEPGTGNDPYKQNDRGLDARGFVLRITGYRLRRYT
jgi:hypothetical protein